MAEYVRLYLEARRQGNLHPEIPPENVTDGSPLIRDELYKAPRPIGEKQLYKLIHSLYFKAGLLEQNKGNHYDLKVHSLRKYFKTQLLALGVQPDYVDYMMGHTIDTYHDIQSLGVERLRIIYAGADLTLRPKTHANKVEMLKSFARGLGLDPEKILVKDVFAEGHKVILAPAMIEDHEAHILSLAIKGLIKRELLASR